MNSKRFPGLYEHAMQEQLRHAPAVAALLERQREEKAAGLLAGTWRWYVWRNVTDGGLWLDEGNAPNYHNHGDTKQLVYEGPEYIARLYIRTNDNPE